MKAFQTQIFFSSNQVYLRRKEFLFRIGVIKDHTVRWFSKIQYKLKPKLLKEMHLPRTILNIFLTCIRLDMENHTFLTPCTIKNTRGSYAINLAIENTYQFLSLDLTNCRLPGSIRPIRTISVNDLASS